MADEVVYPVPKYYFEVSWEGAANGSIICSEASGLNSSDDVIEYRDGKSENLYVTKRPGLHKFEDVVLSKAVFENDEDFATWHNKVAQERTEFRDTVTIVLKNDLAEPVMTWELQNAWVSKWEMPDMNSSASEVSVEKITVVYERCEVTFGG